MRPLLGVWGMGGIPHTTCDALSLERGAQPEASTASEGSGPNRAEEQQKPTTRAPSSHLVRFWVRGGWEALVRLRAEGPPSLRARHSLRSIPSNGASSEAVESHRVRFWGCGLSTFWQASLGGEGDPATRVVEFASLQHGHQHGEQSVGNAAKGSAM